MVAVGSRSACALTLALDAARWRQRFIRPKNRYMPVGIADLLLIRAMSRSALLQLNHKGFVRLVQLLEVVPLKWRPGHRIHMSEFVR